MEWLEENLSNLDTEMTVGNDPESIKLQIHKHKEFQRSLGAKQPAFDTVTRLGRHLKDKCPRPDVPHITEKLAQLKNKWHAVCTKSVDR